MRGGREGREDGRGELPAATASALCAMVWAPYKTQSTACEQRDAPAPSRKPSREDGRRQAVRVRAWRIRRSARRAVGVGALVGRVVRAGGSVSSSQGQREARARSRGTRGGRRSPARARPQPRGLEHPPRGTLVEGRGALALRPARRTEKACVKRPVQRCKMRQNRPRLVPRADRPTPGPSRVLTACERAHDEGQQTPCVCV